MLKMAFILRGPLFVLFCHSEGIFIVVAHSEGITTTIEIPSE
jgi:hypothetical protein